MKTHFKVFEKRKPDPGVLNSSEKCAHCGISFIDFVDIFGDGSLLGCPVCQVIFMSRECKQDWIKFKNEPQVEEKEPEDFIAKCGKECKSLAGKVAHERYCKECKNKIND